MTCQHINLPGGFAIVCSRGSRPRATCSVCNTRVHELLCDFPLRGKKAGKTCSKKLCASCAVKIGTLDYCPAHAKQPAGRPVRIFDHLDGAPEDARFCAVAREMRGSAWWSKLPEPDGPAAAAVAGEVGG